MDDTCSVAGEPRSTHGYLFHWCESSIFSSCGGTSPGEGFSCRMTLDFSLSYFLLKSSSVWILLTRHINSMADELSAESTKNDVFLTIHVHKSDHFFFFKH